MKKTRGLFRPLCAAQSVHPCLEICRTPQHENLPVVKEEDSSKKLKIKVNVACFD
jgi:hypothetical protein